MRLVLLGIIIGLAIAGYQGRSSLLLEALILIGGTNLWLTLSAHQQRKKSNWL